MQHADQYHRRAGNERKDRAVGKCAGQRIRPERARAQHFPIAGKDAGQFGCAWILVGVGFGQAKEHCQDQGKGNDAVNGENGAPAEPDFQIGANYRAEQRRQGKP